MYFDFMTPAVWDAVVVVITLVGLALAGRQIARNRAAYKQRQENRTPPHHS